VFWLLELEEKLALFRQNHLHVSFAMPTEQRSRCFLSVAPNGIDLFLKGHRFGVGGSLCLIVAGGIGAKAGLATDVVDPSGEKNGWER